MLLDAFLTCSGWDTVHHTQVEYPTAGSLLLRVSAAIARGFSHSHRFLHVSQGKQTGGEKAEVVLEIHLLLLEPGPLHVQKSNTSSLLTTCFFA